MYGIGLCLLYIYSSSLNIFIACFYFIKISKYVELELKWVLINAIVR